MTKKLSLSLIIILITKSLAAIEHQPLTKLDQDLLFATRRGDLKKMQEFINAGANVNAHNIFTASPLIRTAHFQFEAACKLLLDNNADIALASHEGGTALHAAAYKSHDPEIPRELEERWQHTDTETIWAEKKILYETTRNTSEAICILIVNHQTQINTTIRTILLCLNRMKNNAHEHIKIRMCAGELYRQFRTLLLPHIGHYVPISRLLNKQDRYGKKAYDVLQIDCLRPANTLVKPIENSK